MENILFYFERNPQRNYSMPGLSCEFVLNSLSYNLNAKIQDDEQNSAFKKQTEALIQFKISVNVAYPSWNEGKCRPSSLAQGNGLAKDSTFWPMNSRNKTCIFPYL